MIDRASTLFASHTQLSGVGIGGGSGEIMADVQGGPTRYIQVVVIEQGAWVGVGGIVAVRSDGIFGAILIIGAGECSLAQSRIGAEQVAVTIIVFPGGSTVPIGAVAVGVEFILSSCRWCCQSQQAEDRGDARK